MLLPFEINSSDFLWGGLFTLGTFLFVYLRHLDINALL